MSAEPVIAAAGMTLGYGRATILSGIDWTVQAGEAWFLLGPNGRGKSTLLKSVMGGLAPLTGSLSLSCGRAAIGFVPQRCDLNPAIATTVREFVALGLVGLSVPRGEIATRLTPALGQVGLAEREGADYWSLSGGQRQRALLARALIRRPALLILDEPTNGLDLPSEEGLLSCLDRLRAETGVTVLFVTHDLALAKRHASHVLLFAAGTARGGERDAMMTPARLRETFGVETGHVA